MRLRSVILTLVFTVGSVSRADSVPPSGGAMVPLACDASAAGSRVTFRITNVGSATAHVVPWNSPFNGLLSDTSKTTGRVTRRPMFDGHFLSVWSVREGQEVPYGGRLSDRLTVGAWPSLLPLPQTLLLHRQESIAVTVNLTEFQHENHDRPAYRLLPGETYLVRWCTAKIPDGACVTADVYLLVAEPHGPALRSVSVTCPSVTVKP